MSSNWGDFNGDGKTNYTDYKIYTTQVDPYSGEYQGHNSRSSGGSGILLYILFVLAIIVLFLYPIVGLFIALFSLSMLLASALAKASEKRDKRNAIIKRQKEWESYYSHNGGWKCSCGCWNSRYNTLCVACQSSKDEEAEEVEQQKTDTEFKFDGVNADGDNAVYPIQSETPTRVICPYCKSEQTEGRRSCCNCKIPFMYKESIISE